MKGPCPECHALDGHEGHCTRSPDPPSLLDAMDEAMSRTHHEPGSAEERYSRQMRFDKYLAMQTLLANLAHFPFPEDPRPVFDQFQKEAAEVLRGMVRPRTPAARGLERAEHLRRLADAYSIATNGPSETAELIIEALKAWERAHPPQPLDPLLPGRA